MATTEPFLRWAGGKSWLVKQIDNIIGNTKFNNYYEPFLGGGAVFFALEHSKKIYLSDMNKDLIDTYIAVRDMPNEIIKKLSLMENTKESYYNIRSSRPNSAIDKAARFIYLNLTSYNGLYRVNKNGDYNVPYGFRKHYTFVPQKIIDASLKLKNATITSGDFSEKKYHIKEGDLVFLDPPYTVSHNNNGFIEYNKNLFSLEDQYRLSNYIDYIRHKGAYYIVTNAAHETIRTIFEKGDKLIILNRQSLIGGKNSKREKVSEYIFTNIPKEATK